MEQKARQSQAYRDALEQLAPGENLARLIIQKRMQLDLTQEQVAERMGTSHSVISRLESGQHQMSLKTLKRLAAAFDTRLVVGFVDEPEVERIATEPARELAAV